MIHEEIAKHYQFGAAPSSMTVYRRLVKLIKEKRVVEDDGGYKTAELSKISVKTLLNLNDDIPLKLGEAVQHTLLVLNRDPEDNQQYAAIIVEKLLKKLEGIEYYISFLKAWQRSPEVIAALVRTDPLINDWWKNQEDPESQEKSYWDRFDSLTDFSFSSEEIT